MFTRPGGRKGLAALAVCLLMLAGHVALADSREDGELARAVRDRLDGAAFLRTSSIDVVVSDRRAFVAGRVDTLADADAAIRLVARVRGLVAVESALELAESARPDHVLVVAVRAALRDRPEVADGGGDVDVTVDGGRVTLRGELARGSERVAVHRAVASVRGVRSVADEMTTPEVDDEALLNRLQALLVVRTETRLLGRIEPAVVNGAVLLRGTVPRPYERFVAEDFAWSLTGVRAVVNEIVVEPPSDEVPLVRP